MMAAVPLLEAKVLTIFRAAGSCDDRNAEGKRRGPADWSQTVFKRQPVDAGAVVRVEKEGLVGSHEVRRPAGCCAGLQDWPA